MIQINDGIFLPSEKLNLTSIWTKRQHYYLRTKEKNKEIQPSKQQEKIVNQTDLPAFLPCLCNNWHIYNHSSTQNRSKAHTPQARPTASWRRIAYTCHTSCLPRVSTETQEKTIARYLLYRKVGGNQFRRLSILRQFRVNWAIERFSTARRMANQDQRKISRCIFSMRSPWHERSSL